MVRPWYALEQEIGAYLMELEEGDRSPRTIRDYRWSLTNMFKGLLDLGYTINPRKIGRREIEAIRNEIYAGRSNQYKASEVKRLIQFCKWAGNPELPRLKFGFGNIEPSNIRWLSDEEARALRANAQGIERMVVHCELDLGMRRIEVLRLKVSDFQSGRANTIHIHGKGRNGGKHRTINWHPETGVILEEYLNDNRQGLIEKARKKNPSVKVPDSLFIYEQRGELRPYKKTSMDNILKRLGSRIGLEISNHDLRRTCGRMMYRAGVRIEQIARIFGHADTRTTIHYLGLDYDDMSDAMALYASYQKAPIVPQMVQNEFSQRKSGPIGI